MKRVFALEVDGVAVQTALNHKRLGPRGSTPVRVVPYVSVDDLEQCLSLPSQDAAVTAITSLIANAKELPREGRTRTTRG